MPQQTASRKHRLKTLRERLAQAHLDGLLVVNPANRHYLSGFTGTTAWLFITQAEAKIVTDGRYWERAEKECPDFQLVKVPPAEGYESTLRALLSAHRGRIGFEAKTVTVSQFDVIMEKVAGVEWVPADDVVQSLRERKEEGEIAAIRRAAALTDAAMEHAVTHLRPGIREAELAWEIEKYMREHGAERVAFPPLVAFGPNSAQPHAETGDTRLEPEMAVCIDMGARVDGYCADLTRSFWYGTTPPPDYLRAWDAVRQAQVAALMVLRPGTACRLVDAVARDALGRHGLSDAFTHSLGHGVGLEVHEGPGLNRRSTASLQVGNVVTVEPGVYLTGTWGIRLEELVVVWDNGPEVLSKAPRWRVIST